MSDLANISVAFFSGATLVAIILGFILSGIKTNQGKLWDAHNKEKDRNAAFREEVKKDYVHSDNMEQHVNLRLDSMTERLERVEAQLEQIQPAMSGLNHSLPGLVAIMDRIEKQLLNDSRLAG